MIEKMKLYYDARADVHDRLMSFTGYEAMTEKMAELLLLLRPEFQSKEILEIGCGTGNWTGLLAAIANHVTAVDSSPRSLALASEKLKGIGNISLLQMDAYDLSFEEKRFDSVFAGDFYSHIPLSRQVSFLRSAARLLKPGGTIVMLDMTEREALKKMSAGFDEEGNRLSQRELPDDSNHVIIKNFPTKAELTQTANSLDAGSEYFEFESLERWMIILRF